MGSQLLFYIGLTLVVGPLLFIISHAVHDYLRTSWKDDIHCRFMNYWNGNPEDKLNAWYRVRQALLLQEETGEKLNYVDRKIADLDKSKFLSNTYVTSEGRWVEDRNIRPYHNA